LAMFTNPGHRKAAALVGDAASVDAALAHLVVAPGHVPGPPNQLHRTVVLGIVEVDFVVAEEQNGQPNAERYCQVAPCQPHGCP